MLIRNHEECIKVKEEDADWLIYHLLVNDPSLSMKDLAPASGLDQSVVDASLERLEKYLLIEQAQGRARVLSFGEALIRCQIKNTKDLPYTMENGVIKQRKA
jgi:DNA-binding MarR family transcriptional regulator